MTLQHRTVHLKLQSALTTKQTQPPLSLMRGLASAFVALAATLGAAQAQAAACTGTTTLYAATNGNAGSDGLGWSTAQTLQGALGTANADINPAQCYEIRVKQGVYKPTASADRTISFAIARPLQLKGGYTGNASAPAERVREPRNTVLSGDIDNNDLGTSTNNGITAVARFDNIGTALPGNQINGSNSHHVLTIGGAGNTSAGGPYTADANQASYTLIEGFTVTGGKAYVGNSNISQESGGGLYCNGQGVGSICSPGIRYAAFTGNFAFFGGAIFNSSSATGGGGTSSPDISSAVFSGNSALEGGAIYNDGNSGISSPNIRYATFSSNSAEGGGGGAIYSARNSSDMSSPSVSYSSFISNSARLDGGAMFDRGRPNSTGILSISHTAFSDNSAGNWGGAIYHQGSLNMSHATFSGNSALEGAALSVQGGGTFNASYSTFSGNSSSNGVISLIGGGSASSSTGSVTASILWGNTGQLGNQIRNYIATTTVNSSIVEGGWAGAGTGNLATDPLLGPLQDNGGSTLTLLPGAGSSAIDAVACNITGTLATDDQRGVDRPQGAACDIGAVEVKQTTRTGTPPGATDPITVSFTGGNATCDYASTQFISAAAAGGALPAGYTFAQGAFGFTTTQCGTGATLSVTLTFAQPVPTGAQLFKLVGITWTALVANINGNTVTYTVTDGGAGDTNPITGVITDPVALGLPIAGFGTVTPVPTLGQWALVLLSLLAGALGMGVLRRPQAQK